MGNSSSKASSPTNARPSSTSPPAACANKDDALLAADLAPLSLHDTLDPSSAQHALPFDILALVVSEADRADLPAWCLVSSAFDRIAHPLLWREVTLADGAEMARVLLALSQSATSLVCFSVSARSSCMTDPRRLVQSRDPTPSILQRTLFLSLPSRITRSSRLLLHDLFTFRRLGTQARHHLTAHAADDHLATLAAVWYITRPDLLISSFGHCGSTMSAFDLIGLM